MPEVLDRAGEESGAPLELEPPPGGVELFGVVGGSDGVVVVGGGVVFVDVVGVVLVGGVGVTVCGGSPPPGGGTTGGGATTLVVALPSGPTEVTVVGGADELDEAPGIGEPLTVIGPPGTALPGTSWTPAGDVPCPPGTPVPPAVAETPGPASSAIAAKAVATTRPLTPSTA
ncbi:hypothetical protein ACFWMR_15415 [Amycolatopsis thailandensis]|uniref:hypothetical protein n=1 Tax=Amycolatopsis thailandensis TaxID=589330 RepID=UPI00366A3896